MQPFQYGKLNFQNQYSCWPPPLFMLLLSLCQIVIFVFNSLQQINDISLVNILCIYIS